MRDILERLNGTFRAENAALNLINEAADEIERLRAEVERLKQEARFTAISVLPEKDAEIARLKAAMAQAIRQHEEGNKGLSHYTLCDALYGKQA